MKNLIDVHVHVAAFPDGKNGCFMSPHFQKGFLVKMVKWKLGLKGESAAAINDSYVNRLIADLDKSERVAKAVVLALDGIYDADGRLDQERTHMMVGNDYVKTVVDRYPDRFLFGASVNPQRRDALDELARVIKAGAKLIKVLPPSQVFDPLDKRYKPYYRYLAEKKVPMLCHIGYEFSVKAGKQEYGFPEGLQLALEEGVNVIGAHACSSAVFFQGKFYETFKRLMKQFPNFSIDLSAVTLPNRASVVRLLRRHPEYFDRFLFGTDYPLSAYATPFLGSIPPLKQWQLWRTKNIFDKQAMVLEQMGIRHTPQAVSKILRLS